MRLFFTIREVSVPKAQNFFKSQIINKNRIFELT